MAIKTIFLDRDGVINKDKGYVYRIDDFEFIAGVFTACVDFHKKGYQIIIITNQSGIGRDYYTKQQYQVLNTWMLKQFSKKNIDILDVFFCHHAPDCNCDCRKPKPGMFLKAEKKYNINMQQSWMIGDKEADIKGANSAMINNTILVRSGAKIDEKNSSAKFIIDSIDDANQIIT